jgi:hypothetical protein
MSPQPNYMQTLYSIATHESAHAQVAHFLGRRVASVSLAITNDGIDGLCEWDESRVSDLDAMTIYFSGTVAEGLLLGGAIGLNPESADGGGRDAEKIAVIAARAGIQAVHAADTRATRLVGLLRIDILAMARALVHHEMTGDRAILLHGTELEALLPAPRSQGPFGLSATAHYLRRDNAS